MLSPSSGGDCPQCTYGAGCHSQGRPRPVLHFPPPPPSTPRRNDPFLQSAPLAPARTHPPPPPPVGHPHDYSYVYNSMMEQHQRPSPSSRSDRQRYISTYGVEENIYEEISEARGAFENPYSFEERCSRPMPTSEEVRQVQRGHQWVLGQLDLAMETLLMPGDVLPDDDPGLDAVCPTDDLLTPDSGFQSGSGYALGWRSNVSLPPPRKENSPLLPGHRRSRSLKQGLGLFSKRGWKMTGLAKVAAAGIDEPHAHSGSWDDSARLCTTGVVDSAGPVAATNPVLRQGSSEESWGSAASDVSSGDESEQSTKAPSSRGSFVASTNRSNGNIINKALTLCEKWRDPRSSGRSTSSETLAASTCTLPASETSQADSGASRLSRWFSIRRGNQYDLDRLQASAAAKMPQLPEEEEGGAGGFTFPRRMQPPTLPTLPPGLSSEQVKRRHIVAAIVHSENSYMATLQRLVNDFKKPLEESSPTILSASKISVLFFKIPEILQCHNLFRVALADAVKNWDRDEKLGDVFVASFSKTVVLDAYSDFINNFSIAMDLAKQESRRKSALADFLKVKQISSHDRLSFFGLMVKPVQRFPQFILFLQDLLKHTPHGHHDRMSLQLALTQLESLAEMLNERKREAEQFQAFREMLRHVSSKFSVRPLSDSNRYLLREDNVTQLEFNQAGLITKSKSRRLLLLNDLLVCVSVAPKSADDFNSTERLSLKWTYPVTDVEVQDTSTSLTLSRMLTASLNRGGSLRSDRSSSSGRGSGGVENLCQEMNDLMHDYEAVSRIAEITNSLKGNYKGLTVEGCRQILDGIQTLIQQKDDEISWVDSCCMQLTIKTKPGKEEQFTFQTENPNIKKEWSTELRLAQLALDPNNSAAWDIPEQERRPSTKMPLFVKAIPVTKSQHQTEVSCGCFYTVTIMKPTRRPRPQSYLWICTTDGVSSYITVYLQQQAGLRELSCLHLVETKVAAMEFVPGISQGSGLSVDSVWLGTESGRILIYAAQEPERQTELGDCFGVAAVQQIRYHCDQTFVALANGTVLMYRRGSNGEWCLSEPQSLLLGTEPVSVLLPINICMYVACAKKVWVINSLNGDMQKSFSVQHDLGGNVSMMAHSGIGLWISHKNSSTICLYHTETFKHLQDINVASYVTRGLSAHHLSPKSVHVTALLASKGLLWVGTNVGVCLTIPLPRLEGVPIISGRANISHHAHFGPVTFLLALQLRTPTETRTATVQPSLSSCSSSASSDSGERGRLEKQLSEGALPAQPVPKLKHQLSSPVVIRRRVLREDPSRRASKTLPRGAFSGLNTSQDCDVYGLYGELMNIRDYEEESPSKTAVDFEAAIRKSGSDPELAAIPRKVSTLDRRLRINSSRPRSLDLSNWSVDSRSSSLYTSSGSEDSVQVPSMLVASNTKLASSTPVAASAEGPKAVADTPRTVLTLTGGRGYVNCRRPEKGGKVANVAEANSRDAHMVLWETKL
ncbi:rho guanine nucleotide exchange factor 10-like protein [Neocloeon triangulifer]|uniref:rho guanine nucleotide exchange factor 10-like protein n=1 Tax=Neocloeon triangulifer TaxID=2078957 RepID=UPI00286F0501|nr:rho guanine nucleotide exchange factor 10-like protein [Neocloeon triangulifer]XP_059475440.1 rho guanine nucleotide exchange factor 10-like protein [Neocloeon triangulifer]